MLLAAVVLSASRLAPGVIHRSASWMTPPASCSMNTKSFSIQATRELPVLEPYAALWHTPAAHMQTP